MAILELGMIGNSSGSDNHCDNPEANVEEADEVEDTTEEEPVADAPEPASAAEPEPLDDVTDDAIDSLFGPA